MEPAVYWRYHKCRHIHGTSCLLKIAELKVCYWDMSTEDSINVGIFMEPAVYWRYRAELKAELTHIQGTYCLLKIAEMKACSLDLPSTVFGSVRSILPKFLFKYGASWDRDRGADTSEDYLQWVDSKYGHEQEDGTLKGIARHPLE